MSTMNDYRKQLARYVLSKTDGSELTAGEIAEQMGMTSQHIGHPRECWANISAASIVVLMKGLMVDPSIVSGFPKKNSRNGRQEPTWKYFSKNRAAVKMPAIPTGFEFKDEPEEQKAKQKPKDAYDDMDKEQLLAIVRISDEGLGLMNRFFRMMEVFRDDALKQLRAAGLDPDAK